MRWYEPMLYPFAFLYDGATRFRNRMFDTGQKKSTVFSIPTLVVGNLSLGGTGKTPMIEFLIELLKDKYTLATLSRGYGRKSTGFMMAKETIGPNEVGDEPFQIFTKYGNEIAVAVGEERILAVPQIIISRPETGLILLDDAFQHRYIRADNYILLTTYQKPFFRDSILPLGTLRENPTGAKRADLIVVTKCPDHITEEEKAAFEAEIRKYAKPNCPIFFAGLKYGEPYPVFGEMNQVKNKTVLVSGIAGDNILKEEVGSRYELVEVLTFPDHHKYTLQDAKKIQGKINLHKDAVVLTTEKDAGKLKDPKFHEYLGEIPIFAIPIKVVFAPKEREFILNQINKIVKDKGYICEI